MIGSKKGWFLSAFLHSPCRDGRESYFRQCSVPDIASMLRVMWLRRLAFRRFVLENYEYVISARWCPAIISFPPSYTHNYTAYTFMSRRAILGVGLLQPKVDRYHRRAFVRWWG